MSLLGRLWDYFEVNEYTLYLVLLVFAATLLKYTPRPRLSARAWLVVWLALGLVLRAGWGVYSSHHAATAWTAERDLMETDIANIHAADVARGVFFRGPEGEAMARRPIGYPLTLGAAYAVFGTHPFVLKGLNLCFHALTSLALFALTRMLFGDVAALWASFCFALYPVSVLSVNMAVDEHLFTALWYGGLVLLFRETAGKPFAAGALGYGVIFGYAAMVRTHAIFMPFVTGLAGKLRGDSWRRAALVVFWTFAVMQAVNLPWALRNYREWGVPVVYTATAHYVYAQVNSFAGPEGGGHIPRRGEPGASEDLLAAEAAGNEGLYHALCAREMRKWILTHPADFLELGAGRLLVFMGWDPKGVWPVWLQFTEGAYDAARPVGQRARGALEEACYAAYYAVFFLWAGSSVALALKWRHLDTFTRNRLFVLGACFALWFAEHMIIYPDRKYRYPLEPLMIAVGAYGLSRLAQFRWGSLVRRKASG